MFMTGRERLLGVFCHQPVDRIPVAPFIHANLVREFYGDCNVDVLTRTVDVYEHFGFDIIHRNCSPAYDSVGPSADGWHVERLVEVDGRDETTRTVVHTPKGDLTEVFRLVWVSEYDVEATPVEYLVKSEEDLDLLMEFLPRACEIDASGIGVARRILGDKGITAPWAHGVFNFVTYYYRSLEQVVMDALINPEFYHRMMEYFLERNTRVCAQYIDAGADVISYAGNAASGKMVSGGFFREYILPYEKQLIDHIQSCGAHVLYHNCGYAKGLFGVYRELGMHAYESLTHPPYGDTILEEALQQLGSGVVLSGGLDQIEFLKTARPDEVRARVKSILDQVRSRGSFILAASDYFGEQTPYDNLMAFAEAGREHGRL